MTALSSVRHHIQNLVRGLVGLNQINARFDAVDGRLGVIDYVCGGTRRKADVIDEKIGAIVARLDRLDDERNRAEAANARAAPTQGDTSKMRPFNIFRQIPHPEFTDFDLVKSHEIYVFVPRNDNLYDNFIPQAAKSQSVVDALDPRSRVVAVERIYSSVTNVMLGYLAVLFGNEVDVTFLDLGSWVGEVSIRYANFALHSGGRFHALCFDPSLAGTFVPFNVRLNGVESLVDFFPVGISPAGGRAEFRQLKGNSDASRLDATYSDVPLEAVTRSIWTISIDECLALVPEGSHAFVKLDVEGVDAIILEQARNKLLDASIVIEFAPSQKQYQSIDPAAFLTALLATHALFDFYYLPRPSRVAEIDETGVEELIYDVLRRKYGYTDLLAVPRSVPYFDKLVAVLRQYSPAEASYMMT